MAKKDDEQQEELTPSQRAVAARVKREKIRFKTQAKVQAQIEPQLRESGLAL